MADKMYDLIVIGSGPGGYTGAVRASQLGLKTCVVEKYPALGGTCLNVGCIPSKALLDSSEHYHFAKEDITDHGVRIKGLSLDLQTMMNRKTKIVKELTGGIQYLFKKNKIDRIEGTGSFVDAHTIVVKHEDGSKTSLKGKNIMLAAGSKPSTLPGCELDKERIISSTEALALKTVPKKLLIVGAGFIGLEMASVWARLGAEVIVVEYADRICSAMDQELSKNLYKILKKQNIQFFLESAVQKIEKNKKGVELFYKNKEGKEQSLKGDFVLMAVGRRPYTDLLNLKACDISLDEKGFVPVDKSFKVRGHSHIFAIGDVIGGLMLAHKAEEEGIAAVEIMAGLKAHVNYNTIPSIVYTWPETASVGKTEEELKKEGIDYKSGKFPFTANGRAKALGSEQGFVKILAHSQTDKVLGVHILGPRASDMIAEAVVAMEFGALSEDIALSFHAHPTLSEVMREAALNVRGLARQI